MMNLNKTIILGSKSPRRQQLLKEAGIPFSIRTIDTDESFPDTLPNDEVARFIAQKKGKAFEPIAPNEIVITADTVVVAKNQILGKPKDASEAKTMLEMLSNDVHLVITAVCIKTSESELLVDDITEVHFRQLLPEEIDYYIQQYQPFDKAGAYGIQEWIGMVAIEKIVGSYFNVVGLPVHKIIEALRDF